MRERLKVAAGEAILAAAEEVICEQGFDAPMEAIAARAGVAVGTLYNHFEDRQTLIHSLGQARRAALLARVDAVLDESKARPFRERLLALVQAVVGNAEEHTRYRRALLSSDVADRRQRRAMGEELVRRFATVLEPGLAEGQLRPDPTGTLSVLLLGLLQAALNVSVVSPDRIPPSQVAELVIDQFLNGAGKRGAR